MAQFCTQCRSLLMCSPICEHCQTPNTLQKRTITIQKTYMTLKQQKKRQAQMVSMKANCPQCNAKKLYYISKQMRSADEGETVFIYCLKCGYTSVE